MSIDELHKCKTVNHSVLVVSKRGVDRYLNYFNGVVRITNSFGKVVETYRGSEEEIIAKLNKAGYSYA